MQGGLAEYRLAVVIGIAIMLLMAGFIVIFLLLYKKRQADQTRNLQILREKHQRDLLEASIRSQEEAAHRIATDLHDDISTYLFLLKMQVAQASSNAAEPATQFLQQAKTTLDETVKEIQKITRELRPTALQEFGLEAALKELVFRYRQSQENTEVFFEFDGSNTPLNDNIKLTVFRVIQELLRNSFKYAKAMKIDINVVHQPHQILATYTDDGVGYDPKIKNPNGLGIKNIESRISVSGGNVIFDSEPNNGVQVVFSIPLNPTE